MPPRHKVTTFPKAVKDWLDQALEDGNFSGYDELAAELEKRGFKIGKSSLQRYGSKLEETVALARATVEQAKAVVQGSPDEDDAMTAAIMRLTQQNVLQMLMAVKFDPEQAGDIDMGKLTKQVSQLVRASIPLKNYQREQRERAEQVAQTIGKEAKKLGASAATIQAWRDMVRGVAKK
jgi:hypothetical protein